ncbi:MAG: AMP-binding protein [Deltaproteobacteria bacterium]|nr:AMP-binding protein [Deltaproteobacteria bacterium]
MKGVQSIDEEVITGFERIAANYPDKTAIVYLGEKFSYAELRELIYRFATALYELGVRDNDKVMIYIPNCPQWVIAYFAIQKVGAVTVNTSPIYTPYEISYQLNDSGAETIICQDTNFGYVREVFPKTPLERAIVTNLVDLLPWHKRWVGRLFDRIPHGTVERAEEVYPFRDLIHKYPPRPPKVDINTREHLAYILYTGGTTGLPKGVPGTHSGMVSYIKDYYDVIEGHVSEGDDIFVLVNPLFHIMSKGMFMGVALTLGNPTILMPTPHVDALLDAIQRYKATILLGVPTLYRMILENDRLDLYNLSSLKYCWSGGDVLPDEVFNRFRKFTKYPLYQVYGSTEVGHLTLSSMEKEPTAKNLGKPFPSRKVKVVDPETLEPVPQGEIGELLVTSPFIMDYLYKPEETARSFVEMDGEKWYRMGDQVRMNEEGELFYVDRNADVIKYKAYRVSASEIEAVLQSHEAVIDSCAVGVPDPRVGERIKAMVVLKEDARGVGASELIKWCGERLAPYKIPQYIEFRDMLPKSKVGKLLRREIREEERRRMEKEKK